ncbi:MAG: ClpP family protease [Anaerovoracaceae bacterium]
MSDEKEKDKEKQPDGENSCTADLIKELGMLASGSNFKSPFQYLSIIGCVEGHTVLTQENKTTKYEHLIPELIAVEENPEIEGLLLILNTVGGDVEAGLALAELVAGISKPTVSLVIGGGHSIGIPLAVSADYSFVAKSATMTLHPIRTSGTLITAEPTFAYMKKTQERVVDFIVEHSKASRQVIEEKMNCTSNMANDVGTLLFGPEAVEIGLVDQVGTLHQALSKLRELQEQQKQQNRPDKE